MATPVVWVVLLACLLVGCSHLQSTDAAYPPNFLNHTGCLYSYVDDANYVITFPDTSVESQKGSLSKIKYDDTKTSCTQESKPGSLSVTFAGDETKTNMNMNSITLEFTIKSTPNQGHWEVTKVMSTIDPVNRQPYPSLNIELKPVDIYAGDKFSYSCNSLVLQNLNPTVDSPRITISLKRFQLQPFGELPNMVFATSYDCAVWLTLPVITGAILILFIVFTVMIGVYLLMEQGNQTSDLKFSKQGGMLMNQAQLDATKG